MVKLTFRDEALNYIFTRKLPILISIFYFLIIFTLILNRFWQYEVFYYDHGYAERAAYQVAHFQNPTWDREGMVSIFTDHVYHSLLIVLAPFYWIWDSYVTPIIVISLLFGLIPLIAYELGISLKVNKFMLYSLIFALMFYIGTQNAIIFFLKDISVSIPFFLLMLIALVKKKVKAYYLLLLFTIGFKETITITTAALGLGLLLFWDKTWRKHALATIAISISYGYLISNLFVPWVIFKSYGYWSSYSFNPEIQANPVSYIINFFDTTTKRETIITSLLSFGFLPIATPLGVLLVLQDFAQRFVLLQSWSPLRQGLNLHYNISLAAIMFFASAVSLQKLQTNKYYKKIIFIHAVMIFITILLFHRFVYHGPFGLLYNKDFFKITNNMKFMDDFVEKIPEKGKIMTQNNLAVRFTHKDLYILSTINYIDKVNPDVIALDFRPGQNINNFWPVTPEKMEEMVQYLKDHKQYIILYSDNYRYIFTKSNYQNTKIN